MPRGRDWVMGEQLAQVDNRDPFAVPVWRSPVYRTPEPVIMIVQLVRLIWRLLWFALTHPGADAVAALVVVTWLGLGWPGVVGLAVIAVVGLAGLRVIHPVWFGRFVAAPVRDWLRWWFYRRRWKAAMTLAGLAPDYRGQDRKSTRLNSSHMSISYAVFGLKKKNKNPAEPPPKANLIADARRAAPA